MTIDWQAATVPPTGMPHTTFDFRRRRARYASVAMMATVTMFAAMTASTIAYCKTAYHPSQALSRAGANHVAAKIAELREKNRNVSVRGLSFSPDGEHLAARSAYEDINIWNWRSGRIQRTLEAPKGFASGSSINPIQYSSNGRMLAICEDKGIGNVVARVWNTGDWSLKRDIVDNGPGVCRGIVFSPNGRLLVYAIFRVLRASELVAYSTDSWRVVWRVQLGTWPRTDTEPQALAVSPGGRLLAVSGTASILSKAIGSSRQLVQIRGEQVVHIVSLPTGVIVRTCRGDAGGSIAWSPDESRIAVVGGPHMETFDVTSCERSVGNSTEQSEHLNVRLTPDGRYVIESDSNGREMGLGVSIWDSRGKKLLQRIPGDSPSIALSRDGKFLAVGGIGHTTIWEFK